MKSEKLKTVLIIVVPLLLFLIVISTMSYLIFGRPMMNELTDLQKQLPAKVTYHHPITGYANDVMIEYNSYCFDVCPNASADFVITYDEPLTIREFRFHLIKTLDDMGYQVSDLGGDDDKLEDGRTSSHGEISTYKRDEDGGSFSIVITYSMDNSTSNEAKVIRGHLFMRP